MVRAIAIFAVNAVLGSEASFDGAASFLEKAQAHHAHRLVATLASASPDPEELKEAIEQRNHVERQLQANVWESQALVTKLKLQADEAGREAHIAHREQATAQETNSTAFAEFLGSMWREMRTFAQPYYVRHLKGDLELLADERAKLQRELKEKQALVHEVSEGKFDVKDKGRGWTVRKVGGDAAPQPAEEPPKEAKDQGEQDAEDDMEMEGLGPNADRHDFHPRHVSKGLAKTVEQWHDFRKGATPGKSREGWYPVDLTGDAPAPESETAEDRAREAAQAEAEDDLDREEARQQEKKAAAAEAARAAAAQRAKRAADAEAKARAEEKAAAEREAQAQEAAEQLNDEAAGDEGDDNSDDRDFHPSNLDDAMRATHGQWKDFRDGNTGGSARKGMYPVDLFGGTEPKPKPAETITQMPDEAPTDAPPAPKQVSITQAPQPAAEAEEDDDSSDDDDDDKGDDKVESRDFGIGNVQDALHATHQQLKDFANGATGGEDRSGNYPVSLGFSASPGGATAPAAAAASDSHTAAEKRESRSAKWMGLHHKIAQGLHATVRQFHDYHSGNTGGGDRKGIYPVNLGGKRISLAQRSARSRSRRDVDDDDEADDEEAREAEEEQDASVEDSRAQEQDDAGQEAQEQEAARVDDQDAEEQQATQQDEDGAQDDQQDDSQQSDAEQEGQEQANAQEGDAKAQDEQDAQEDQQGDSQDDQQDDKEDDQHDEDAQEDDKSNDAN